MNIFKIAHKEWLQNIRNIPVMLMMTVMPLVIIMLIGLALGGVFSGEEFTMSNVSIHYQIIGNESTFTSGIKELLTEVVTEDDQLVNTDNQDESLKKLKNGELTVVVIINETNQMVSVYKNNLYNNHASIIEGLLNNFTIKFNVITEVLTVNPTIKPSMFETSIRTLSKKEVPSSIDYYGVVMAMLFSFYGIVVPFTNTIKEKKTGTLDRILTSSISGTDLLLGKILGNLMVNGLHISIVIGCTILFFDVNFGSYFVLALIMMYSLVLFVVAFGIGLGILLKSEEIGNALIHTAIVAFGFFGGAYMPLYGMGILGQIGKFFSPLWWSINGMMSMIYENKIELLLQAISINIVASVLFIILTSLVVNKRGGKYA